MKRIYLLLSISILCLGTKAENTHDWENQHVLQINREPARASFTPYFLTPGDMSMSLDGMWKFNWTKTPEEQPSDFYLTDFNDSKWTSFPVPGDWEVNGYGTPIYCSSGYTFKIDPPYVMKEPKKTYTTYIERNPTGCYRRTFTVPDKWNGKEVYIHLGSVSSAFYIWINGVRVGYSQDSMSPAEFRITPYLKSGINHIALQVFKYSDGSYLEDQDTWRIAGIHRSISIYATPKIRIRDFGVRTILDDDYRDATLIIDPQLSVIYGQRGEGYFVEARLFDENGNSVCDSVMRHDASEILNLDHKGKIMNARNPQRGYAMWGWLKTTVKNPKKWTAETPNLYTLRLSLVDNNGKTIENIETKIGFRKLEMKDGRFLVNGKQVRFRGTNRQEMDENTGRVITTEQMIKDIKLLKQCNVNAVRTGHYPNDPRWYELCDQYGLYIMDEANLEEHGLRGTLASDPSWTAAFMDRVQRVVIRDRNHPCVMFWSLGNESGYGINFAAAATWAKEYDPTRFIHYEGAQGAGADDPAVVDVISRFYPRTMEDYHNPGVKDDNMERPENARWERLLAIANNAPGTRPVLTSEYAHAMGNAMGNFREYWDEIYSNPRMLGGFIWTWADEGIAVHRKDGKTMIAYGGDFGDKPNLKAFCLNGVIMSDRNLTPKYYEVKAVYAPLRMNIDGKSLKITMLDEHASIDNYSFMWSLAVNGKIKKRGEVKDFTLPAFSYPKDADVRLDIKAVLKNETPWAKAGHEVASAQFAINDAMITAFKAKTLKHGKNADMEKAKQWLDIVSPHFFRAPTDNDKGFGNWLAKEWTTNRLDSPSVTVLKPLETKKNNDGTVTVTKTERYGYTEGSITVAYDYTMDADGAVDLSVTYTPEGTLPTLPCLGNTFTMSKELRNISWYGRGPLDTYPDRKEASSIALWNSTIDNQYVHYPRPQYNGNHEDVAYVSLTDNKGKGWVITTEGTPFSFTALPYSTQQLCNTSHDCDLKEENHIYLSIDAAVLGLGNSSCGPGVLKKYTIPVKPHTLKLRFTPIK
ncbi:DUF4981 domain-containing protein [Prevotella sp. PCHR]|uniref:beta-galactosidase n=1 Tax=Xylanibacter caecicola TaxID=2736294 RepID=A0ABX2B352_9BACT|nr:glycoside hydrolase family 2 TIM barrel-domain containing protein [Xylanibacter caecicola]NPE24380.1 DUF4981 domain-containing protein [Xylanibacter caecicola]